MSARRHRFTATAEADIEDIQAHTLRQFGPVQAEAYGDLIDKAGRLVGESPMRPGTKARDDLEKGVRSFHLEIAASRRGGASHVLYFVPETLDDGTMGASIFRVLWEGMDPERHVALGLSDLEPG